MKIAILDLAAAPPHLMGDLPYFGVRTRDWLAQGLPEAEYDVVDIQGGAEIPPLSGYDGVLVTGSDKGVYDDVPWMEPLRALLLEARDREIPVLGLCFGHQIMADTWGGKAEKSDTGNQVGVRHYTYRGQDIAAHAWHKDQVTRQPPNSEITASADYCPIAGLKYDFPAMSVQFHPEYTRDYMGRFIDQGRGEILDNDFTDEVLESLASEDVPQDLLAKEAADFFRRHIQT